MCLNKKVLAGVAVAAVAIYFIAPDSLAAALPVLVVAICPLSMLVVMRAMPRRDDKGATGSSRGSRVDEELLQLRREVAELRSTQMGPAGSASEQPQDGG